MSSTQEFDECGDPKSVTDNVTVMGLNKWYSHKIEKLGWMVIDAKTNGESNLKRYKCGLQNLLKHIKAKSVSESDRQNDLKIMEQNVLTIHGLVVKMLESPTMLSGGKRGSKKGSKKSSKKGSKKGSKKSSKKSKKM